MRDLLAKLLDGLVRRLPKRIRDAMNDSTS